MGLLAGFGSILFNIKNFKDLKASNKGLAQARII